ncbi:hypothetical protein [Rhizobium mongolense]|uniref:Uncharacterized protein n=1 Tax=Rhizobium mongolense TaxID=57676 RepID=A0A7W6WC15_9HYPH|nr:hypothetical protein [Rhizobium mongolense]MBB4272330.1 hypothetical protein [Rhizobium mongolense]
MTIQPATIQKLGKLFPRLASNHDGEVIATARAIIRTLESAGSSLHDLGAAMAPRTVERIVYREKVVYRDRPTPPQPAPQAPEFLKADWKKTIHLADILLTECDLNARPAAFVRQMKESAEKRKGKFRMSAKQADWWDAILDEHDVHEAEAA